MLHNAGVTDDPAERRRPETAPYRDGHLPDPGEGCPPPAREPGTVPDGQDGAYTTGPAVDGAEEVDRWVPM